MVYFTRFIQRSGFFALLLIISFSGTMEIKADQSDSGTACSEAGMVVTACPIASAVGKGILERGGNAVDAAVAVGFALAVTYPAAGNIGGGGFLLLRMKTGEIGFIDFREKAPLAAKSDMYLDRNGDVLPALSTLGHRAAGVPGSVAGLYTAHRLYCSLPWRELVEPAIALAKDGFPVSGYLSRSLKKLEAHVEQFPSLGKFFNAGGISLERGERLRQPDLARTLERIADKGPGGFYDGETAELIAREMERGNGLITKEDLKKYEPVLRNPVLGSYRGYEIISAPPPSSGGTILIEILNILEGFPLSRYGAGTPEAVHCMVEAEKRAYADRAQYLGDDDFVDVPLATLISKDYAEHMRSSIGRESTPSITLKGGNRADFESAETTHYSIIDAWGNAVAVTTTLNGSYGSKVVVEGAGFLLNNEMDDFSIKPGAPNMYGLTGGTANAIAPEKRMLSSMTPTIVLEGEEVRLILGTPGGSTIITTVAQILVNIIDYAMNIEKAVSRSRFHHQWSPDHITYESGAFSDELRAELEKRGHSLKERESQIGNAQVIQIKNSLACGFSDPRGGGKALGVVRHGSSN